MHSPILAPVAVLVLWTIVMLFWAIATRLPAFKSAGIDVSKAVGSRPNQLDGILPDSAQWKMHNYIHLMEQPTLFYAICGVLALTESGGGLNASLAWGYVGVRIAHSILQATINIIRFRFALFAISSLLLTMLAVHGALAAFGAHHL